MTRVVSSSDDNDWKDITLPVKFSHEMRFIPYDAGKDFEDYLASFKHGMPPHGGFGMGLERLTKQMFKLDNIRHASLFPRDRTRIRP